MLELGNDFWIGLVDLVVELVGWGRGEKDNYCYIFRCYGIIFSVELMENSLVPRKLHALK